MDRSVNTGGRLVLHGFSPLGEGRGHPERSPPPLLTRCDKRGSRRKLAIRTNDYNRRMPRLSIGQSRWGRQNPWQRGARAPALFHSKPDAVEEVPAAVSRLRSGVCPSVHETGKLRSLALLA